MTITRVQMNPESGEFEEANGAPATSNGVNSPDAPAPASTQIRTDAGVTYRAGAGPNEVMSASKVEKFNAADLRANQPGILASAVTPWGSAAHRLTPDCLVTLPGGGQTSLKVAEAMGLVQRVNGEYREVVQQAEARPEPTSAPDMTPIPTSDGKAIAAHELHAAIDETMNAAMKGLDSFSQEQLVQRLAMDKLDGAAIHDLARANGIEPAEMQERVDAFNLAIMAELAPVAHRAGVADLEHFAEWADENYSEGELMDAFMAHVYGRDTSAYARMMERYVATVLPRTEDVEKGGVKVTGAGGKELVTINGNQTSLAAAVRMGLIK